MTKVQKATSGSLDATNSQVDLDMVSNRSFQSYGIVGGMNQVCKVVDLLERFWTAPEFIFLHNSHFTRIILLLTTIIII